LKVKIKPHAKAVSFIDQGALMCEEKKRVVSVYMQKKAIHITFMELMLLYVYIYYNMVTATVKVANATNSVDTKFLLALLVLIL
jgi:hypothetical protein